MGAIVGGCVGLILLVGLGIWLFNRADALATGDGAAASGESVAADPVDALIQRMNMTTTSVRHIGAFTAVWPR